MTIMERSGKTKMIKLAGIVVAGAIAGLLGYNLYISNAVSYLSEDSRTCINCHVMIPQYATWQHSSHARVAGCADCHVPQTNPVAKYVFKARDGFNHATAFTLRTEPQVITAREEARKVIMENCKRCHSRANEGVGLMSRNYDDVKKHNGRACWDCHREVPHGRVKGLGTTPHALVVGPGTGNRQ